MIIPLELNAYDLEMYLMETFHEYSAETRVARDGEEKRFRLLYNGAGYLRVMAGDNVIYQGKDAQHACNRFMGLPANA